MNSIAKIMERLSAEGQEELFTFAGNLLSAEINEAKLKVFMALQMIKGFGPKSMSLFFMFSQGKDINWNDLESLHWNLEQALSVNKRLKVPDLKSLEDSICEAVKIAEDYQRLNIKVVPIWSDNYPHRLKNIEGAPIFLYCKGNISALNSLKSVAIIGTRKPTSSGYQAGLRYGKIFAEKGFAIVSGLALGCDTAGHHGCLDANGVTIAVLAHSLDVSIYPKENKLLAEQILDSNGLLVSEYPLGTKASKASFVQRDKWQAALSDGIIVVESGVKGGTMHTVSFAKELSKSIGCLYLDRDDWKHAVSTQGNLNLLKEGVLRLSSTEEIEVFTNLLTKTGEQ